MGARSKLLVLLGAPLVIGAAFDCGGSTATVGGSDASVDSGASSSGSTSGSSSGGSSGTSSSSGASSGSSSGGVDAGFPDSGGGPCDPKGVCALGLTCCGAACVNLTNDPFNCGACGHACQTNAPMCNGGQCTAPTCEPPCTPNQRCCNIEGPGPSGPPRCVDSPTCPVGCPLCN